MEKRVNKSLTEGKSLIKSDIKMDGNLQYIQLIEDIQNPKAERIFKKFPNSPKKQ